MRSNSVCWASSISLMGNTPLHIHTLLIRKRRWIYLVIHFADNWWVHPFYRDSFLHDSSSFQFISQRSLSSLPRSGLIKIDICISYDNTTLSWLNIISPGLVHGLILLGACKWSPCIAEAIRLAHLILTLLRVSIYLHHICSLFKFL